MVRETVEIKFTGSSASLKSALNSIAASMQKTSAKGKQLNSASKSLNITMRQIGTNMRMVGGHLTSVIGRYVTLYALTRTGIGLFRRAFFAVESFNTQVIQTAALWTSFSKDLKDTPLAQVFSAALDKSEKLHQKFIDINDQTLATVEHMGIINRELAKQGIELDATNEKQMAAFANLTNTIAILTAGMANVNIQFGQEIRAVLEGLARQGTTLSLVLKAKLGKEWRNITQQWKRDGVLVEKLAEQFKGVDAAAIKLKGTWTLVGTSFTSLFDTILRLGMEDIFREIVDAVASLNSYLKENREELVRLTKEGFEKIAEAVKKLTGVSGLKTLEENLRTVTARFKALFLVIASVATISAIGNLILALDNLYRVVMLIGGSTGFVTMIAFLSNPAVLAGAAIIAGVGAAIYGVNKAAQMAADNTTDLASAVKLLGTNIDDLDTSKLENIKVPEIDVETGEISYPELPVVELPTVEFEPELKGPTLTGFDLAQQQAGKAIQALQDSIEFEGLVHEKQLENREAQQKSIEELTNVYLKHHAEISNSYLKTIDTWGKGNQTFRELTMALAADVTSIYRKRFFQPFASMLASITELAVEFTLNLFDAKKREALASAVLSAHEGAAAAFANAGGFPLGLAAYAATLAQGLAEAAAIQAVSLDTGTMNVPKDMPANIHKGEIIVPRSFSESIRQGKATLGKRQVDTSIVNNFDFSGASLGDNLNENYVRQLFTKGSQMINSKQLSFAGG